MEGDKGTVCVTGGTGFIASWLIKRLLEEGYSVHTTVRADSENKRDLSFLTSLPGAAERLKIFNADLSDPDSFDAAIEGCKGVLHVASPVISDRKEPEEVVTKRVINGALGILKSCLKSKTVKRVVYTSTALAVVLNNKDVDVMDESYWTDVDFVREKMAQFGSYMISKTLTEKALLEFAEEHGMDLVTVIPTLVVGPFICPEMPVTVKTALSLILGNKDEYLRLQNTSMVHVDDVARAHIFLLEHPDAKGRYNCTSDTITLQKMAQLLSAKYPEFPIPTPESLPEIKGQKISVLSTKKILDAGFKFNYGVEEMFEGAIKCCKEKGYL